MFVAAPIDPVIVSMRGEHAMLYFNDNEPLSHNVYSRKNSGSYIILRTFLEGIALAAFVAGTISVTLLIAVMVGAI
jgi:hypothetical protein